MSRAFKGEQCHHCLVPDMSYSEFPNSSYVIGVDLAADGEDKSVEVAYCVILKNTVLAQTGVQICLHEHGGAVVEVCSHEKPNLPILQ